MSIGRERSVLRLVQLKLFDDGGRPHVEVIVDELRDLLGIHLAGAERVYAYRYRLGDSDRVCKLHLALCRDARRHDVLCDVARHIGSGSVDLCRVLSGKGSAAMRRMSSVSVYYYLTPREARVSHRSAYDESACRVDEISGLLIDEIRRHHRVDDIGHYVRPYLIEADIRAVLRGYHYGVYPCDLAVLILDRDLRLAVRSQVRQSAVLPDLGQPHGQHLSVLDRKRHKLLRLGVGVAEHHALVARAYESELVAAAAGLDLMRFVDAHRDVRRLSPHVHDYVAGVAVEAGIVAVVSDLAYDFARDSLVVDIEVAGSLAEYDHHACLCSAFAGYVSLRILSKYGIEDSVGHLVAELVRMSFSN